MNDAFFSMILQGILGYVILPYVLWHLTYKSHKISDRARLVKFILLFDGLYTLYFFLPGYLKLLYLVIMISVVTYKFLKLNVVQSFLTSFIFIVIFLTAEIVGEMVGQIANIVIDNFTSEVGFLDSIKFAMQSVICVWMIRSFKEEFSTLIYNRGQERSKIKE